MSVGNSNVMFSSSSSSSSSSSATKVGELIKNLDKTTIKSCVIGISELSFHFINKNFAHAALFLSDKKRSKLDNNTEGVLIEYGNYPPDDPKSKKTEEDYVKDGHVIYKYEFAEGGVRYYTNTFEEYKNKFCDIGYISLNINKYEQKNCSSVIEKIAPKSEKIWIKKNYNAIAILSGKTLNCQTFICHCIDILKPTYESTFITKGIKSSSISEENKESIIPGDIKAVLKKYEDGDE